MRKVEVATLVVSFAEASHCWKSSAPSDLGFQRRTTSSAVGRSLSSAGPAARPKPTRARKPAEAGIVSHRLCLRIAFSLVLRELPPVPGPTRGGPATAARFSKYDEAALSQTD